MARTARFADSWASRRRVSANCPIFVVFIYFRAPWRQFVPDLGEGDAVQINNPDVTGIFVVAQGDLGVFMTTYFPSHGETIDQFTRERCRETLLGAVGAEIDVEIVDVAPWQPYEQGGRPVPLRADIPCRRLSTHDASA